MKKSGAITMIVLGLISFAVALFFVMTTEPFEPSGRTNLPAVVLEVFAVLAGIAALVIGVRGLRGTSR